MASPSPGFVARQLNLPNTLTVLRIFLVPILVVVILTKFDWKEWISVAIFLVAAGTDWLDGWLARRNAQVTTLGKLLDPLADKLLISGALISLVEVGVAPAWMVVIIVGREFAVTGLRGIASERGVTIEARSWGKLKMGFQVACISALLLSHPQDQVIDRMAEFAQPIGRALLWGTVLLAVVSGVAYFREFRRVLDERSPETEP